MELAHPRTSVPSFPFWIGRGEQTTLWVPHRTLQNAFQSPDRNEGLMFLRENVSTDLALTYESSRYHYVQCGSGELGFESSIFLDGEERGLRGRWLREHRQPGPQLAHWTIRVGREERPPDGWMNPFVVRLEVSGTACGEPPPGVDNDPRSVFRKLQSDSTLLGIVPEFDAACDARAVAWTRIAKSRTGPFSAVERIVVGAADPTVCRPAPEGSLWPFLGLDSLGGAFIVERHGEAGSAPDGQPLTYQWRPPINLKPNGTWIAANLVEMWGTHQRLTWDRQGEVSWASAGEKSDPGQPDTIPRQERASRRRRLQTGPAAVKTRGRASHFELVSDLDLPESGQIAEAVSFPRRTFAALPSRFSDATIQGFLDSVVTFTEFFHRETGVQRSHPAIGEFFIGLLAELAERGIPLPETLQQNWLQLLGESRLACDFPGFLNSLSRTLVSPQSRCLARLPREGNVGEFYVDLVGSVPSGDRALLWGLLRGAAGEETERQIKRTTGWWNTWHQSLLDDDAGIRVRFLAGGFTLGEAQLGDGTLGGMSERQLGPRVIRFSVPL
ncbi:MAG: hypothetical protein RJA70_1651 [Pseudomonadota bacterium]